MRLACFALVALTACERNVSVGHEAQAAGGEGGTDSIGNVPDLLWQATHEPGTLEEWLGDDGGWLYTKGSGTVAVSEVHAHSGKFGLEASISTEDGGMHQAVLGRDVRLEAGRYGAWYFFPESPDTEYWVVMKLSNGRDVDRFDVDVYAPGGSEPRLRLFEHGAEWITEPAPVALPIGRWVHIEAQYRSTANDDGQLIVLQDGEKILDTGPRSTASDDRVSFIVGSVSWHIAGAGYRLFVDDASIALDSSL